MSELRVHPVGKVYGYRREQSPRLDPAEPGRGLPEEQQAEDQQPAGQSRLQALADESAWGWRPRRDGGCGSFEHQCVELTAIQTETRILAGAELRPGLVEFDGYRGAQPLPRRVEDDHALGEIDGLVDIVRDEDHRRPRSAQSFRILESRAAERVDRTKGFVHEEQARARCEGPRDREALLHPPESSHG